MIDGGFFYNVTEWQAANHQEDSMSDEGVDPKNIREISKEER
jgi:hypothetical protein